MKITTSLLILFLFFISAALFGQINDLPPNQEPGKCYAKCMIPGEIETYEESYPVYIGEDDSDIELENIHLQIKPEGTQWVQKKADPNCISRNPKDCLAWCLVKTSGEWVDITMVADTSQTDDFIWETYTIQENREVSHFTEWKEVLCGNKATHEIITNIQQFLQDKGYQVEKTTGNFDTTTKAALTAYQRHNNLPIGQLDKETLNSMGIHF